MGHTSIMLPRGSGLIIFIKELHKTRLATALAGKYWLKTYFTPTVRSAGLTTPF
jgi:hypothetical protein